MTSPNPTVFNDNVRAELQPVNNLLNSLILGKQQQIKLCLTCILARGHLLLEDLPGMGKTVLSHALGKALGLEYNRVQFTNDLLPADLLGASVYQAQSQSFHFIKGPVFTELLLADEINRATPKTQSALLEVMEEQQVSLEGETHTLPAPFFVIATQNPAEQIGTAPLPESQLDRFLMRIQMGYPVKSAEMEILAGVSRRQLLAQTESVLNNTQLLDFQKQANQIEVSDASLAYLYELLQFSRSSNDFVNGLSTRAGIALLNAAKAWAWVEGESSLLPAHIQAVFPYVAGHRLQRSAGKSEPVENAMIILEHVAIPR